MPRTAIDTIRTSLRALIARYGFRVTTRDIRAAGIPEAHVFDAVCIGLARIERTHVTGDSVYIVFA